MTSSPLRSPELQAKLKDSRKSWIETHHEIVAAITLQLDMDESKIPGGLLLIHEMEGRGGIWELCESLANEFENINTDRIWDGEYYDELDSFIELKLSQLTQK